MKDRSSCSGRRRKLWAVLLKKVWDIDALKCPKCGRQMKVISFLEQPSVIRRICRALAEDSCDAESAASASSGCSIPSAGEEPA